MTVGTDRDDLATETAVTPQNILGRIWVTKPVLKSGSVDLNALAVGDQLAQDLVNDIGVGTVSVELIFVRTIAHHIVKVTIDIVIRIGADVGKNRLEVVAVSLFFRPALIVCRVIDIHAVNAMRRADDKVEGIGLCDGAIFLVDMRLKSDLDAPADHKSVGVVADKLPDLFLIGIKIQ